MLGSRAVEGVKVAISVADTYDTVPVTSPPAMEETMNVDVLIVAGFIALLKVAVITAVLGHTRVEPAGGVTAVTVGGVSGASGFPDPAILSGSLQPAIRAANKNAERKISINFTLRISFSSPPSSKYFFESIC